MHEKLFSFLTSFCLAIVVVAAIVKQVFFCLYPIQQPEVPALELQAFGHMSLFLGKKGLLTFR